MSISRIPVSLIVSRIEALIASMASDDCKRLQIATWKKIERKSFRHEKLSPLLLFRDKHSGKLVIADGYHRLCAVYTFDEDAMIPCKIV